MPTTANYAFPYPASTDPPNGAAQLGQLATAVDTQLGAVANRVVNASIAPIHATGLLWRHTTTGVVQVSDGTNWTRWAGIVGRVDPTTNLNFTNAETIGDSITATLNATNTYKLSLTSRYSLNTSAPFIIRFRYVAGAGPITTSSTQFFETIAQGTPSNDARSWFKCLPSGLSGQHTIGATVQCAGGATTGLLNGGASGIERELLLEALP